jgi:hypothetical protein
LLLAICKALGIETHDHHEVRGIDKSSLKSEIRQLKTKRGEVLQAHDRAELKLIRRRIREIKRTIRKAAV